MTVPHSIGRTLDIMLSSQCTFDAMAYFDGIFLSRNGEESFNNFLSPDPDHPRGGASYGDNTPCVINSSQSVG